MVCKMNVCGGFNDNPLKYGRNRIHDDYNCTLSWTARMMETLNSKSY